MATKSRVHRVVMADARIDGPPNNSPVSSYRVKNNETVFYVISNTTGGGVEDSSTARSEVAKADITVLQWKWPAARDAELTYLSQIKAIRPDAQLYMYMDWIYWFDSDETNPSGNHYSSYYAVSQNGAPTLWRARNGSGADMGHAFSYGNTKGVNFTQTTTNGNGQRYGQIVGAFWYDVLVNDAAGNRFPYYSGVMFDDYNVRSNYALRTGSGNATDWDYDGDNVDEDRIADDTFLSAWLTGLRQAADDVLAAFPGYGSCTNPDFGYWYRQGSGSGALPLPVSSTNLYHMVDVGIMENMAWFGLAVGNGSQYNNHTYPFQSYFSVSTFYAIAGLFNEHVKPAESNKHGRAMSCFDQKLAVRIGTSPTSVDYAYARMIWASTKFMDGLAYGAAWGDGNRPFFLDEQCIELGEVRGTRSIGTLNQSSPPVTFTLRAYDYDSGGVQAFFQEFDNAIVVWRVDTTGLTLGSSNFGDGSPSSITLPSAGTGYRWDEPNAASYVHPTYSDLAMTSQDTTTNSGATGVTSVSLRPIHAKVLLRVAV